MSERKAREFWIIDKAYHRYMEVSCYEAWNEKPIAEDDETLILVREVLPDDELEKLRAACEVLVGTLEEVKKDIEHNAADTLWCHEGYAMTVVDRIEIDLAKYKEMMGIFE